MTKIKVTISGADGHTAYIALPGHRHVEGIVNKTVTLADVIIEYKGPQVNLDFTEDGQLIGIEILA